MKVRMCDDVATIIDRLHSVGATHGDVRSDALRVQHIFTLVAGKKINRKSFLFQNLDIFE